jgi:hypothetical protein
VVHINQISIDNRPTLRDRQLRQKQLGGYARAIALAAG